MYTYSRYKNNTPHTSYYITDEGLNYVDYDDIVSLTGHSLDEITDEDIVNTFVHYLGDIYEVDDFASPLLKLAPGQYRANQLTLEQKLRSLELDGFIRRKL